MLVEEGYLRLKKLEGMKMSEINKVNKGFDGQNIESAIGLKNESKLLDFEDGDLKTNKYINGKPSETLAISQMQNNLIEFEKGLDFYDSWIYKKIRQFIYLPIDKTSSDHIIGKPQIVSEERFPHLYKKLAIDFNFISLEIKNSIDAKKTLNTINGPNNYLQIRTKASKKKDGTYTPMTINGHQLKDKYMAFYFKKDFLYNFL